MSLNPLAPVTDHQSMLNRIFWFTTASTLAAVWLLRLYIPGLEERLSQIDFTLAVGDNKVLPVPGGFLIPALAAGMLTRIYRIHAVVSNLLGIRETFDIDVIIRELAAQSAIDLASVSRDTLVAHRHSIMRRAFYPYVNSFDPCIDPQLIGHALDAWSWFWIGIEATSIFVLTGLVLVAAGVYSIGLATFGGTLVLAAVGLPAMRAQCRRYAIAQVRAIVSDSDRANVVRRAVDCVMGTAFDNRRAA
jgi:hypothetical protein